MARGTQNRASRRPQGRQIGYARVSTDQQTTEAPEIELRSVECDLIIHEHGSGASRARPVLTKLLRDIGAGDTLVVGAAAAAPVCDRINSTHLCLVHNASDQMGHCDRCCMPHTTPAVR